MRGFEMGTNWSIACNKCEIYIDIGKRSPAGFSFWSAEEENMKLLREMLEKCTWEHPYALCFINENDERTERFKDLEPDDPDD